VISAKGGSRGSGFLFGAGYVGTAFHVVGVKDDNGTVTEAVHDDLRVRFATGEEIPATCISIPRSDEKDPVKFDFAILRLSARPKALVVPLTFAHSPLPDIGDLVLFSGYPLDVPMMVSHQGLISGWIAEPGLLALQAPINKGNSGGAVLNQDGQVIGIITLREGGIAKGLEELRSAIKSGNETVFTRINGVDPLAGFAAIVDTLNKYISTGIGYARPIRYLATYARRHGITSQ